MYPGEKLKMGIAILQIPDRVLLWLAKDLLNHSEKIDKKSFIIHKSYGIFQTMLGNGNPFPRFSETLCIRFVDITTKPNHIELSIEIIINPE